MKSCRVLALWSGPRNLSTAMMRSFEARGDTQVMDEPLYAYYLQRTGIEHPGREQIIAQGETDWSHLEHLLVQPPGEGHALVFQKHMTQHVIEPLWQLPSALDWMAQISHAFLIRQPAEVIASYARVRESPTEEDIGITRQARIYDRVSELTGREPPVIDAADVRSNPGGTLARLCEALGLAFSEAMLRWPAGRRASDGVWAPYWYGSVERSTGFAPGGISTPVASSALPVALRELSEASQPAYRRLYERRLRATSR